MKLSIRVMERIKYFEGFRAKTYICPSGFKTIGYGHKLSSNDFRVNIDKNEAEVLLLQDITKAAMAVVRNINTKLTEGQFDALISFVFNLGSAALQRSTLRQKINRNEHEEVPKEFMRWIYANGKILPGLIRRREMEVAMYLS